MVFVAIAAGSWTTANAASYEVKMVNKGSDGKVWQFEPAFLKIAPGDTVTFVPTNKGHNSEALQEVTPEGVTPWKGKINEAISVTYDKAGVYAYKCLPHAALGMVGVVQVGEDTSNLNQLQNAKVVGKGKARLSELVSQVAN